MAEYIERSKVLNCMDIAILHAKSVAGNDPIVRKVVGIMKGMRDIVSSASAADVAPAVHGRWIIKKNYHHGHYVDTDCFCSECGTTGSPQWKGCPVCLARMDGE